MSTLTLYMKSGNVIKLRFIANWTIKGGSSGIQEFSVERKTFWLFKPERLIFPSLTLSQIEAITETKGWFDK